MTRYDLIAWRILLRLDQATAAEKLGLSASSLTDMEMGRRPIYDVIPSICKRINSRYNTTSNTKQHPIYVTAERKP